MAIVRDSSEPDSEMEPWQGVTRKQMCMGGLSMVGGVGES